MSKIAARRETRQHHRQHQRGEVGPLGRRTGGSADQSLVVDAEAGCGLRRCCMDGLRSGTGHMRQGDQYGLLVADVTNPAAVISKLIHAQADHLHVSLIKFRLHSGHSAQFSGAYGRVVSRVRKQHAPAVS